jgi:hypothetical protein
VALICSISRKIALAVLAIFIMADPVFAAIGCDLNDPNNDVPRLYPESTSYKTTYVSLDKPLLGRIVMRLGERFKAIYEPLEVPYTLYDVYRDGKRIGYIHGVNQKGQFGVIQVFVALDLSGRIKSFYIQKMTSPGAKMLRDSKFGRQFVGLSLKDFDSFDPVSGKGSGRFADIRNPSPEAETDFYAVLRALKKNLVLMDEWGFSPERGKP